MSKMRLIISNWRQSLLAFMLLVLGGYLMPQAATAQDFVWTGAGSAGTNNWNDPANWLYDIFATPVSSERSMALGWFATTNTVITGSPQCQINALYFFGNDNYVLDCGSGLTLLNNAGGPNGGTIRSAGGTNEIRSIGAIGQEYGTIVAESGMIVLHPHLTNAIPTRPGFEFYAAWGAFIKVLGGSEGAIRVDGIDYDSAGTVIYSGTSHCRDVMLVSGTMIVNGILDLTPASDPYNPNLTIGEGYANYLDGGILAGTGTIQNIGRLDIPELATLRPGDPETNNGIGTLTFTNALSYLDFKSDSTLEIRLGNRAASSVVWPERVSIHVLNAYGNAARLALVQNEGTRLANGTYTLLTYQQRYDNGSFDVTFNGGPLPNGLSIEYGPHALVLKVSRTPSRATVFQVL